MSEKRSDKYLACLKYLNMLPKGYRERAVKQMDAKHIESNLISESESDALSCFCHWSFTKEEWHWWNRVRMYYADRFLFPRLPQLPDDDFVYEEEAPTKSLTKSLTDSELLQRAIECIDMYLNAGNKESRSSASVVGKELYEMYYGKVYRNKNERL